MKTVLMLLSLLCFAGCFTAPDEVQLSAKKSLCREQGSAIIRAIAARDFPAYSKYAGENPGISDRKEFLESCQVMEKRLGKMKKFAFVTELRTPEVTSLVYCIDFCREGSNGKKIEHQQLFQLVFGKVDGNSKLLAMRIM